MTRTQSAPGSRLQASGPRTAAALKARRYRVEAEPGSRSGPKARSLKPDSGITLLEVIFIMAVLAILASAITPAVVQRLIDAKVDATREEEKTIYLAIVGDQSKGQYGFVGDIGRLPSSLLELAQPGSLPLFTVATTLQVGIGWKGPYVNVGDSPADYQTDAFGRPYGGFSLGHIVSGGVDGIAGTVDDIVYPPSPTVIFGRLSISLTETLTSTGRTQIDPPGYTVRVYYASEGAETNLADASPPYVFENIPMGLHAITVQASDTGQQVAAVTTESFGGNQTRLVSIPFTR